MADQQQLDVLRQGTDAWNAWREKHPVIQPDLSEADLSEADLSGADLRGADLSGADLSRTIAGQTTFGTIDLRQVKGLKTMYHISPSSIGIDTLERSQGDIPEAFLRGAGLSDTSIAYAHSLKSHPIEYYTCFISYSSKDETFAKRLHDDLQQHGVRCWFAPHDIRPGSFIRDSIDQAIRLYDKLLLILSQHSVESTWVRFEVEAALDKEARRKTLALFPLRLDDSVLTTERAWAAGLRRERHIDDFTGWNTNDVYQQSFKRLLNALQPVSKGES